MVVPGVNPACRKLGGLGGVDVGASVGQFSPKVRFNLEKAIGEDGRGSNSGGMSGGSGSVASCKACARDR